MGNASNITEGRILWSANSLSAFFSLMKYDEQNSFSYFRSKQIARINVESVVNCFCQIIKSLISTFYLFCSNNLSPVLLRCKPC